MDRLILSFGIFGPGGRRQSTGRSRWYRPNSLSPMQPSPIFETTAPCDLTLTFLMLACLDQQSHAHWHRHSRAHGNRADIGAGQNTPLAKPINAAASRESPAFARPSARLWQSKRY
jgi:hypothetical protein